MRETSAMGVWNVENASNQGGVEWNAGNLDGMWGISMEMKRFREMRVRMQGTRVEMRGMHRMGVGMRGMKGIW